MTDDSEDGRAEPLVVFAAGSLRPAFERGPADGAPWPGGPVVFRFANARDLALAIEQGERADVFASASPTDPERLHAAGILMSRPPLLGTRSSSACHMSGAGRSGGSTTSRPRASGS